MITTSRNIFVGCHVTPEIRKKLAQEAAREGKTVSFYIYETFAKKFGFKVEDANNKDRRR